MTPTSFRHLTPAARIFYGDDCLDHLPGEIRRVGCSRVVVFCGRTLSRSNPGLATVRAALGELFVDAFAGVVEQSPISSVEAGAALLQQSNADAVIALGGGSAVVSARAATILYGERGSAEDLCTVFEPGRPPKSPRLAKPKLPQFVVPTTPTTAYAKTGAAISLPESGRRLALFDPKVRAQALFLHPSLFTATPARLILDASLDAFAQGIQGLESQRREPLADALLLHGVRLIRGALQTEHQADDVGARGDLMLAAQLIGEGTDYAGAGLASALGHGIGARFSVANGLVKAIVLPHTIGFNASATGHRLADVTEALGMAAGSRSAGHAEDLSHGCAAFFASLGVPSRLRDIGVARDGLPEVADEVMKDWFFTQNPRKASRDELMTLIEAAW